MHTPVVVVMNQPEGEDNLVIKDLETGKRYRVNERGDQVEINDGEEVPVDEFMELFGYLKLPRPATPNLEEEQSTTPTHDSHASSTSPGYLRQQGDEIVDWAISRHALKTLVARTRRRISESPSPGQNRHRDTSAEGPRPIMTNKKSDRLLSDLRLVQELNVHTGVVWVMQFNPNHSVLATGGEDTNIYLWRVIPDRAAEEGNRIELPVFEQVPARVYKGHKSDILDISWAPGSEFLISASLDKSVRLWHTEHESCLREFPHANYVTSIRFHPQDSGKFISGSGDGVLRMWSIAQYKVVASASIASEKDIFTALCFSNDGRTIVAGCFDGRCRIYNVNGNRLEKRAEIDVKNRTGKHRKGAKVTGIVGANVGTNAFLVSTHDSRIRLIQATTPPRHLCKFKGHENDAGRPIVASANGNGAFVVSGSDDGRVFIWNGPTLPFKKQEREKISETEAFQAHHHGFCPTAIFCPNNCRRPYDKLEVGSSSVANYRGLIKMIGTAAPDAIDLPPQFGLWGQVIATGGSRGEIRIWENFGVPR